MDSQAIFSLKISFYYNRGNSAKKSPRNGENLENFSKGVCDSQGQFIFLYEILVFDKEFSTNPRSLEEILKILEGRM